MELEPTWDQSVKEPDEGSQEVWEVRFSPALRPWSSTQGGLSGRVDCRRNPVAGLSTGTGQRAILSGRTFAAGKPTE